MKEEINKEKVMALFHKHLIGNTRRLVENPLKQLGMLIYFEGKLTKKTVLNLRYKDLNLDVFGVIADYMEFNGENPIDDITIETQALLMEYYHKAEDKDALVFINPKTQKPYTTAWFTQDLCTVYRFSKIGALLDYKEENS